MNVTVRVPATSANLGPGFDVLGIALSMYNTFEFERLNEGLQITGCDAAYATEENLAIQAWRAVERKLGVPPCGIRLHIQADVPVTRGLGSSATLLAAGVTAANECYGRPLDKGQLLYIITEMEGHPDNVAPALLGGLRASMVVGETVYCEQYAVHSSIGFCALIPNFETSTREARAALPKAIGLKDAVFTAAHLTLMLRAFENGNMEMLGAAMDDCLHQPHRKKLINEYDLVRQTALANGAFGFCISGSGSTLLALVAAENAQAFSEKMEAALSESANGWKAYALHVDNAGSCIV